MSTDRDAARAVEAALNDLHAALAHARRHGLEVEIGVRWPEGPDPAAHETVEVRLTRPVYPDPTPTLRFKP